MRGSLRFGLREQWTHEMRLQVCGTSVKIPHISLAEMKKKIYSPPMSNGCTSWTALETRLQVYLHGMRCEIKEKILNANCEWEKKLTGRVLVVKNTSTHCSNNNAALNISRLQLCGVSKKEKRSMLPSDGGLWELHPTYQNMTNGVCLNTSQVKCIYDLSLFKAIVISVSDDAPPSHQEGHEGSTWTRTFTNCPKHKTFADN